MNWDADEHKTQEQRNQWKLAQQKWKQDRHQKQETESSGTRNILLVTIAILMFVQVGFSVVGEMRYQAMKSKMETVIEKWTGDSGFFDTPIDFRNPMWYNKDSDAE